MKIGVVDLDTSHPQNWIPIERELGHDVVGVWDGGSVHPPEYVRDFAAEHNIPRVYESLDELAADVDCAIVHGCDWDTHVGKSRPFIEAHKAVLVDKPIAGNLTDLQQYQRWADEGARIAGGSSLRFADEVRDYLAQPVEERGEAHTVFCGCGVDEFNYGIHAYSLLFGIFGGGAVTVQHMGGGTQRRIRIDWADGRIGVVAVGAGQGWIPFHAAVATDKSAHQFIADSGRLYHALLAATLPYLAGEVAEPPMPMSVLLEPELCAIAARRSWLEGDREVRLDELDASDDGYDGSEFARGYRTARYPDQAASG